MILLDCTDHVVSLPTFSSTPSSRRLRIWHPPSGLEIGSLNIFIQGGQTDEVSFGLSLDNFG